MSEHALPLFKAFPKLGQRAPYLWLDTEVTPVQRLAGVWPGGLYVKRDDLVSKAFGGNKVRKLEFALADAIKQGKTKVATMGGIGTNHGLATAIFAKKLGLDCDLYLFPQFVTEYARENLKLMHYYGARLILAENMAAMGVRYYLAGLIDRSAYFIYAGGSSPLSTLGLVNAAFELKAQIEAGQAPEPGYIFCPTASNGTLAGLSLGVQLSGLKSKVVGVRVGAAKMGPLHLNTMKTVKSMQRKTLELMNRLDPSVPKIEARPPRLLDEYIGEGYGFPTEEGNRALARFRDKGEIYLEPVYTAKTCAALLDFIDIENGKAGPYLYWQTNSSADLAAEAASVDYMSMPREFHKFFKG